MGKLKELVLNNFKSYKGHHVLQFGDSYFTSIIGPNGSGKSNSMDAISFVLGIKSSHLRSTHLKDLVYRGRVLKHSKINADGTATEGDANGDTNGHAEAGASDEEEDADTQTSTQRNDPSSAWVMAVFEDDAGEEQRWKRSITSNGQSEYRINNKVVTAKQYNEALEAENILIKARNFLVFQGDVESIANQNPKDLTRLIEQISGSLEYKADYERLKAEKEKADEDQQHKLHQRRGINGEIKQYQQQKEELDRYQNLEDEKDAAVVNQILWKLYHFQRTIDDSTEQIQKHQAELKEFRRTVQKYDDQLDKAKQEQAKVGRDISKVERDVKRKEKALEEKANDLVPIDEKISLTDKKLKQAQRSEAEIKKDRDNQKETADKYEADLAKVQKAQRRWDAEWRAQQQQSGRELNEQDLQEYQRLRGEVYKRSGSDQMKVDNTSLQLKTDEETVNSLRSKVESTQAHIDTLDAEIAGLNQRKSDVAKSVKATTKEIDAKKKAINAIASERERTSQKHRELDEKLYEVLQKLSQAQDFERESRKDAQQRETVAQLKRIFPGVKGMIHQLCKPKQKKYEHAVVTALGREWDSVVVESHKIAQDCMAYLRDQRIAQVRFIPLDTIIHQQPNANLRGLHTGMRLAIDTIDFDNNVERAMHFACENAIVTDTMKIAKHLCYERKLEVKAVALDGTVIHKGGNMTGGQEPSDKKRRFEEAEVDNLRTLVDKFRGDIEALPKPQKRQAEQEQLQSDLSGLELKLKYDQDELKTLERNIESKTRELDHEHAQLAEAQPKFDEQSRGLETLKAQLEEYTSSIAEVEDEVFDAFCSRLGYQSIRDYEKQHGSQQQEAEEKRNQFIRQISRLNNSISFEKQRLEATEKRLRQAQDTIQRSKDAIEQLQQEKEVIAGEMDVLSAEVDQLNEQLSALREESEARGDKVNEARREVQKRSKSVEKMLKEVAAHEAEVQKASAGRYGVLKTCKLEGIDLPLEQGSRKLDALPAEDAIVAEDEDAMDVDDDERAPAANDFGIHLDFTDLDDDLKEDPSDQADTLLTDKITSLTDSLTNMTVNTRSADKLSATSDRLKATERSFTTSRTLAKNATAAFEAVKETRLALFQKAFVHIAAQIQPVYRDLTKTTTFPLGGQASLDLEDDDEPYLQGIKYHAMPPLKRFRDMEHLSGGEKTMAALALLFAVHTFAPSPFFVLDEVDAALDNANTWQLAQYVREHAGPGMQFVVISLKTGLFQCSETLVGVMRDQGGNSSRALTLDLRKYQAV
ncbi:Structural maintenance of chromosomes protein 1B [Recurvomyces mirabilis]|nr:Structural maintenance of chromosomes protein 1B [Recurvomyces mirabilis]